jgi:hypothetical protein
MKDKLIIQKLHVTSVNRNTKDIGTYRSALSSAENIGYHNRSTLYDIYEDIRLDGQLSGVLEKRFEAVLNKTLHFIDQSGARVKEMENIINSECFRNIIEKIIETPFYGVSGLEFIPGRELAFNEIPRKHIKIEKKVISRDQNDDDGIPYEGVSNLWIVGNENDLGILLKCAPYVIYKRAVMGDWAQFIEIFGHPIRLMYYDAYDTKTKMELRQVLDESGSSLALMIPKQAQFEMYDGKESNANGELFERFIQSVNRDLSVIVLGNTETTNSSKNSGLAQAEVHASQQNEKFRNDLKYVKSQLNSPQFIRILRSYGLPVNGGKFEYEKEIDLRKLRQRIDIDIELDKMVPLGDDYWYRTYGLPKPKNYEQIKAKEKAQLKAKLNDESVEVSENFLDRLVAYMRSQFKQL